MIDDVTFTYKLPKKTSFCSSFIQMAREKSLFAIHYPYLDDLPNVDDITEKRTERRRLKNATSPIAIFVSVKRPGKDSYELKPVAIQTDCHSGTNICSHILINNNRCNYIIPIDLNHLSGRQSMPYIRLS